MMCKYGYDLSKHQTPRTYITGSLFVINKPKDQKNFCMAK